jgi:vesicle-fusing ATPase
MRVPPISDLRALEAVLHEVKLFSDSNERRSAIAELQAAGYPASSDSEYRKSLQIGIKKLLSLVEMSRQEPDNVLARFVTALTELEM